mgnify:FL=1
MTCNNEWDQLEEVIVGSAIGSKIPKPNKSLMSCMYPTYTEKEILTSSGLFPAWLVEEQEEDLDALSNTLKSLGVKVHRPDLTKEPEYHYHCPRDLTLIVGNTIIETPSPLIDRKNETQAYKDIFTKKWKDGYKWVKAPTPSYKEENYQTDDIDRKPTLLNKEPMFEAANCMRINNDILYQVSNTGNELGGQWLQDILMDKKVHILHDLYSYAHLDSTIIPLREGLVLYNASRVTQENEPKLFKSWDKIWIDECYSASNKTELPWGASAWIGLNLLSVNPNLAIVDKKQKQVIEKLKKHDIDIIPLELRHDRLLAGGFHCVTLDLSRKAK